MEPITPFDLHRLFLGDEPPLFLLEIVVRVVLIYGFAVVALRFMGKRGRRQMSTFDYVVVIALGSATGDAMFYPDVPVLYAWLVVAAIVFLEDLLARLQDRFDAVHRFLNGEPRLLVRDGEVLRANLGRERMSRDDLLAELRVEGIADTGEVRWAFVEPSGQVSVIRSEAPAAARESTVEDALLGR